MPNRSSKVYPKAINRKIRAYIEVHRKYQSRFEIDSWLLEQGYHPQAIEAAWTGSAFNPHQPFSFSRQSATTALPSGGPDNEARQPFSFSRFLKQPELWILLACVVWLMGMKYFLNSWPAPLMSGTSSPVFISGVLAGLIGIGLLFGAFNRRKLRLSYRIMFALSVSLFLVGSLGIFGSLLTSSLTRNEIASTQVANHTYHVVLTTGCIDSCNKYLYIYRCDQGGHDCSDNSATLSFDFDTRLMINGKVRLEINEADRLARLFTTNDLVVELGLP